MSKAKKNAKTKSAPKSAPAAKKSNNGAKAKSPAAPAKKADAKKTDTKKVETKKAVKPAKKIDVKADKKQDKKTDKKAAAPIQAKGKKTEAKTDAKKTSGKVTVAAVAKKGAPEKNAPSAKDKKGQALVGVVVKGGKEAAKDAKAAGKGAGKGGKTAVVVQEQVSVELEVTLDTAAAKVKAEPKENIGVMLDHQDVNRVFSAMNPEDLLNLDSDECQEKNCDNPSTTGIYCRFHYIKNWNEVKRQISIIKDKKLQGFIEDLFQKYGSKQLEQLCHDLSDEKSFFGILKELNIEADEEAFDEPDEDVVDDDTDIAFETKNTKVSYMED